MTAVPARDVWQERPDDRAWLYDRCRQMSGQFQALHQGGGPHALHRIHHLSGSCDGEFADCISRQPVVKQIWDREQMFGGGKNFGGFPLCRDELIQRVDGHELNAGRVVDLFLPNFGEDLLHDTFGPAVAVMVRILE